MSRCNPGQAEEIVHQIERRDQQHALPQNGYQRRLKGFSRSLQKIAAQVKEAEKGAGQNQPKEETAAQGKIRRILQEKCEQMLSAKPAAGGRKETEAGGEQRVPRLFQPVLFPERVQKAVRHDTDAIPETSSKAKLTKNSDPRSDCILSIASGIDLFINCCF